ncbi:putative ribonuclease H-like domain-containing protein [Tanacetum coccineum]
MYYPRFTKVIINHFMSKDQSIPRRNKVDWYMAKDDPILTTMRFIPKHKTVQKYGAILPDTLTNQAMKESDAYKTYYDLATGKVIPKPKYVRRSTREKTEQAPKASPGKRLKATAKVATSGKKKLPAQGLETLSEIALSEAKQMKVVTKRSKTDYHVSHASGSGANEGTGVTPRVPDVPTYGSEDEQISWKSSDKDDDDEVSISKDDDDNTDDEDDDDSEQSKSDNDGDDFVHPKFSTHDEEDKEEKSSDLRVHTPSHFESTDDELMLLVYKLLLLVLKVNAASRKVTTAQRLRLLKEFLLKAQRRLELKARSTLLMGILNEHKLKFNSIKDAKSLLQAVEKRFGGNAATKKTQRNLLKQLYEIFTASSSEVLDQTFDRLQKLMSQLEIHGESILQEYVNQKFLRKEMDLRWQMAMLKMTARRFLKNTRRKFSVNGTETIGFDKETTRRVVPVETSTTNAMVSCYGSGYDWSDQAEEGPTNFALMAYSSTSSNSEVSTDSNCSSSCLENVKILKEQNEQLLKDLRTSKLNAIAYKTVAITELRRKLELAQKQKDEIKLTVENFENSSKRNFMPLKLDLSFSDLEEFVNEPIVSVPIVKKPVVETTEAKASADNPKVVRKNIGPLLIEDWISNSEDEAKSKPKIEKKTHDLEEEGVIDSGCSRHMTGNMSYLTHFKEINEGYVAFGGNPKGGKITSKGTIKTGNLDFENVYFVRELKFNLFSVSQMCDKKNSVLFNDTECIVLSPNFKLTDESHVLLKVPRKNNMYSVDLKNIVPKGGLTCLFAKATSDESKLWHRRLGHINFKTMNKLVKGNLVRGLPSKLFENNQTCVACQKGKQHRASCKSKIVSSISQPLHMLHMDLFGPTFVKSLMKKMYFLVVTDDYSRFSWVFFLATKDETSGILKSFITRVENLIDQKVKVIRCDNGTEFKNKEMNQFCKRKGFMRPFGCPVTILNTIDHLGKFDGKVDEGFFVGYLINRSRPNWLYDIDALTKLMNYKPVVVENQSNGNACTKACDDAGDDEKKKDANVNSTNIVYTVSSPVSTVGSSFINADGSTFVNVADLPDDLNMPPLEDIVYSDDVEDVGAEADMNNLDAFIPVSPIPTTRVHKDHPIEQIIRDLNSAPQTRRMTKNLKEHCLFSSVQQRTNHKDFQNCLFACFLSQVEPKKETQAMQDPSWIEAMQDELLQFKLQKMDVKRFEDPDFPDRVYKVEKALYGLHQAPRAWYETFATYLLDNGFQRGKIDKTLFIKRDKGDILLVQLYVDDIIFGSTKKSLCTEFEKMMHKKFQMSSMDKYVTDILKKFSFTNVRIASTRMETHKPLLKDENGKDIDEHMYRSIIGSLMYLTSSRPDIIFAVYTCARYQVNPKVSHLYVVKRIFRYLKGQPKLGLWYPKDSSFDLVAYTNSDYARASLDRKSTTGGCQFLRCRLMSWQCK